jgi:hypothetical protein
LRTTEHPSSPQHPPSGINARPASSAQRAPPVGGREQCAGCDPEVSQCVGARPGAPVAVQSTHPERSREAPSRWGSARLPFRACR